MFFRKIISAVLVISFWISCSPKSEEIPEETPHNQPSQAPSSNKHSYHPTTEEEPTEVETPSSASAEEPAEKQAQKSTPSSDVQTSSPQAISVIPFPIDYEKQSVAGIDFNTTREQANQILSLLDYNEEELFSFYKEGIRIQWDEGGKAIEIYTRQGNFVNTKPPLSIGQVFLFQKEEDPFAVLINLYNMFEKANIHCFEEQKCFLFNYSSPNQYVFVTPKARFLFQDNNNNSAQLLEVNFQKDNLHYHKILQNIKSSKEEASPSEESPVERQPAPNPANSEEPAERQPAPNPANSEEPTAKQSPSSTTATEELAQKQSSQSSPSSSSQTPSSQTQSVNSLLISYEKQSIADIDFSITRDKANQILSLKEEADFESVYREGIGIKWDEGGNAVSIYTSIDNDLTFDIPNTPPFLKGQPIRFNSGEEVARLLIYLYNLFEKTDIDCLAEKKCFVIDELKDFLPPNMYMFYIPKMQFLFYGNTQGGDSQLIGINFHKDNTIYKHFIKQLQQAENSPES